MFPSSFWLDIYFVIDLMDNLTVCHRLVSVDVALDLCTVNRYVIMEYVLEDDVSLLLLLRYVEICNFFSLTKFNLF